MRELYKSRESGQTTIQQLYNLKNPVNVFDQDQKHFMENLCYTALYKVAKRLDFLLDFCIEKNREKNLVVWPRLKVNNIRSP